MDAIKADPTMMTRAEQEPQLARLLQQNDTQGFQHLLRATYQDEVATAKARTSCKSIDAQRAAATVPRDTVQLYEQLRASGLEYGPAFRLLRNVHVPDTVPS